MIKSTQAKEINQKKNLNELLFDDVEERLNDVELNMAEAKEFTHLSSDAIEDLQNQLNELRGLLEQLIMSFPNLKSDENTKIPKKSFGYF